LTVVDPSDMVAGFSQAMRGRAQYSGVLRNKSKTHILWTCPDDHRSTPSAKRCAEAELERRLQGRRAVIDLGWCSFCRQWWTAEQVTGRHDSRVTAVTGGCPRCDVPLESVKLVVLERRTVS
jgi:hypothetical protein